MRVYVYIDGFNLYYRALKNTSYKWLDVKDMCKRLLKPEDNIISIKYFTALVNGINDPGRPIRQKTYLRALQSYIPEIKIFYGFFLTDKRKLVLPKPIVKPANIQRQSNVTNLEYIRTIEINETKEKGSNVNLAVHLLNDACHDRYDCAVVISNDSDIKEALNIVKTEFNKQIGWFIPYNCTPSVELNKTADFRKMIRKTVLANSQLPDPIPGTNLYKPTKW
ncbi:NYN domain-containing protein [Candidatus Magnetobacterium casense]|uniref:NYN domain-containing protein n=1 Tax=Candidatus Magnetobacterium casense TaxID=1455061 RepID=UPI00058F9B73|nr:NYN domain-containing protein [Candidatus Magnetobacterium casensis]